MWRRGPDGEIIRSDADRNPSQPESPDTPTGEPEAERPAKRARLALGLRLGLRDTYDFLGSVLLMSVLCSLTALVAALGGLSIGVSLLPRLPGLLSLAPGGMLALAGLVLAGGPLAAGVYRFCRNAASRQEPELFDLAWGFRHALGRSLRLAAVQAAVTVVLVANAGFYLGQRYPVLTVLGAIFGYVLCFWAMAMLYQWPLLAEQEIPVRSLLKKSALLVLDNFPYSLLLGILLLVLTVLLWGFVIPGVILWGGLSAMLLTQATRELLRKYDVLPPDPTLDPISEETHDLRGHRWRE